MASIEFQNKLTDYMPNMRSRALTLTRNTASADDLVQDTALRALRASDSFDMDTNFPAWIRRIMMNHFISGIRAARHYSLVEEVPEVPVRASQQDRVDLRDMNAAIRQLPTDQQSALTMIILEGCSYENAAARTGEPVGTLKSRVHRSRLTLRDHMNGEKVSFAA